MDYNDLDLRNKTFLDFTGDSVVIARIIGADDDFSRGLFYEELNDTVRALTYQEYAEIIGDKEFIAAVNREFKPEFEAVFNE